MRQALEQEPDSESIVELFLEQLDEEALADPKLRDEAIDLHRRLLTKDPLLSTSLRGLRSLCHAAGRVDEAFNAESCLVLLGEATEEETYFFKQRRGKLPSTAVGSVSAQDLQAIGLPRGDHPLRALLRVLKNKFLNTFFPVI